MGVWTSSVAKQINPPSHVIPQPQWDCLKEILGGKLWMVHQKKKKIKVSSGRAGIYLCMSALWPDLFFLVWNFRWSPFCPSQKYFLRWKCSAPHLALLRSPLPEHWHSAMGALMPQRAVLLLRHLQQLPLHQRPRPKGPHSAVSLLGAERDLIVSGPRT